ncbi:Nucleoporin, NUP [Parasponia andersonii]|uniref:Nuclear pore complex protein NUP35 n=1 Tax=Parasponia andersonii TaxID=3476 RepID=A0A2P5BZZ5_PARAD|nr:Nucleoporin, NUP [Parasponia andersonii]
MSTTVNRTPKSGRQSLFFQDLASPISARRGKFSSPGQAAAVSALWRANFVGSDLPPPPVFTLEDRSDFSPESGIPEYPVSPEIRSDPRSPVQSSSRDFLTPLKSKSEASTSGALMTAQQTQQGSAGFNWWSPTKSGSEQDEKGKSSPVEGVVQPGALITLPPPREVARPEMQRNTLPTGNGNLNEEEWVTVYGFSPADTNLVLREFEKCGVILKHVPGPRDANWMHILYQNRSDAQKALSKNGMQINGMLIVGVKPLDPMHRQALNDRLNNQGFMTLPPQPSFKSAELSASGGPSRPYYLQNGNTNVRQTGGAIASPTKSLASKLMDLMFGV